MLFRRLDPDRIARNAELVAARKRAEGCVDCADGYRELGLSTRRGVLARAGGLAAAGLGLSLVDVGGIAAAAAPRNPLGGWLADVQLVAPALLNWAAYLDARKHPLHEGVDVGHDGAFMRLPASTPLAREAYTLVQPFAGGVLQAHLMQDGQSVAVATLDGRSQFATHYDGARRLALRTTPFPGRAPRGQLPGGRLLPQPGARLQVGSAPGLVPAASASTCDVACALMWGTGWWAFFFFFTGWAAVVCGIVYCGVAGT